MEDRTGKDDGVEEEIADQFLCCVCLELLYKPIVLSCGHISCFWCVHWSMNSHMNSHCPICRDPYVHFPSVCQKLHFLLKKIYPIAHKKREEQTLKDEQERDCFSPQIDHEPKAKTESVCSGSSLNVSDEGKVEECSSAAKLLSGSPSRVDSPCIPSNEEPTDAKHENDYCKVGIQISKEDLLCSACKKLLVRPVVLNCGHVYCEGCVVDMAEESEKIRCQECHVCDPRGFPKVCLVLEQLLEKYFPEEYNSRRSGIQKRLAPNKKGNFQRCQKDDLPWWERPGIDNVHLGAGCDSCGVYPIIGDRYRCKDCKEKIGYDLCKDCYETPSKVPGRFNQQHTPDHTFELAPRPELLVNSIGFFLGTLVGSDQVDEGEEEDAPPDSDESSTSTA